MNIFSKKNTFGYVEFWNERNCRLKKVRFFFFRHYFSCFHVLVTIFLSSTCRLQRLKEVHPREVNVYDDDDSDDAKKTVGITTIFIEF